jgi:hypothetical protein
MVTATVGCPSSGPRDDIFPISAGARQRFFMVCNSYHHYRLIQARIYQFRVTSSGQVSGLAPVPGGRLGAIKVNAMAVSPNGAEIAINLLPPESAEVRPGQSRILVINALSGERALWRNAPSTGHASLIRVYPVSFSSGGRSLVFVGLPICPHKNPVSCHNAKQVRVLSPASQGGYFSASSLLMTLRNRKGTSSGVVAVSPDGSTIITSTVAIPPRPRPSVQTVTQISHSTAKEHIIYKMRGPSGTDNFGFVIPDVYGRHFIIDIPGGVNGWLRDGKLIPLKPAGAVEPDAYYEAW